MSPLTEPAKTQSTARPAKQQGENAIAVTLGLVGDEWNLLILRVAILEGAKRYKEWQSRLGVANAVLASRLGRLTKAGLFDRVPYQDRPVRHEYLLTAAGRSVWRVLLAIWAWELRYVEHQLPIEHMSHSLCGHDLVPVLTCASCLEPVGARDVRGVFGPAGGYARSVPIVTTRRRSEIGTGPGLFPETMALIGNRWSAAMLSVAFQGAHRFTEFEQRLGAPPTIVADRLRTFCQVGVLDAKVALDRADRNWYSLTDKGLAFFPVVAVALDWGQRWFPDPEGPAMLFRHPSCGRPFEPRLACDACRVEIEGRDVIVHRADRLV